MVFLLFALICKCLFPLWSSNAVVTSTIARLDSLRRPRLLLPARSLFFQFSFLLLRFSFTPLAQSLSLFLLVALALKYPLSCRTFRALCVRMQSLTVGSRCRRRSRQRSLTFFLCAVLFYFLYFGGFFFQMQRLCFS